jgi:type II secretory pathway pseudopilin PulG
MTLIELSVVLLVMVGLAGVAVPYVAGMADKAHDSTTASTINQLNQTIASFRSSHNALPDNLETLTSTSGGTASLYGYMISDVNNSGSALEAGTINNIGLSALRKAGITKVMPMAAQPGETANIINATFKSTLGQTAIDLNTLTDSADTLDVAMVKPLPWGNSQYGTNTVAHHLAYALGGDPTKYDTTCYDYIAMGIGDQNEMIGSAMQSAPVLFAPNGDFNPEKKYARFLAIIKVQKDATWGSSCPDSPQPASFEGVVADMDFAALVGSAASQSWATSTARQSK